MVESKSKGTKTPKNKNQT